MEGSAKSALILTSLTISPFLGDNSDPTNSLRSFKSLTNYIHTTPSPSESNKKDVLIIYCLFNSTNVKLTEDATDGSKNIEFILNYKALNTNIKKTNDYLQLTDFSSTQIRNCSHHG